VYAILSFYSSSRSFQRKPMSTFASGMGRGLPDRLAMANPPGPPSYASNTGPLGGSVMSSHSNQSNGNSVGSASHSSVGPLGGTVAPQEQRRVESDPSKGEYQAWAHLDPSRNDANSANKYIPGLNQRPASPERPQKYIPGVTANLNPKDIDAKAIEFSGQHLDPKMPDSALIAGFLQGTLLSDLFI
jgi:hypothetical protein